MLPIKYIRESPDKVKKSQRKRGEPEKIVDKVKKSDKEWRKKLRKLENLRQKRNEMSEEIKKLKRNGEDAKEEIQEMKKVKAELKDLEPQVEKLKERRDKLLESIPAVLHESVPQGEGEEDNVEIKRWGETPKFNFEPRIHVDILEDLGILDMKNGSKVAGSDFYFLRGELAKLDRAIRHFALDFLEKKGFEIVIPPYLANKDIYEGMLGAR